MARLYDSWDFLKKMNYNPDGSMKESWRKNLLESGMSESEVNYLENIKMLQVKKYDEREQQWLEKYGVPYSEWEAQGQQSLAELERRQNIAIRNGEEISSLPLDIDPDDYYDQVGNAGLL